MSHDTEIAWIGRANVIRRVLQSDSVDIDSDDQAAITKVQASFGGFCIDTDVDTDLIALDGGTVEMSLGLVPSIAVGRYVVQLTVYDSVATEGYSWGSFSLIVRNWTVCD
jgi:hypothetical protein